MTMKKHRARQFPQGKIHAADYVLDGPQHDSFEATLPK